MNPLIRQIAIEYKAALKNLYGNHFVELILFGSYARGDSQDDSDADFAIILRGNNIRSTAEIPKTSLIGSRLSLKYGIPISSFPTSLHKMQFSSQGIYTEIRKEGVII